MTTRSAALILTAVALLGLTACKRGLTGAATGPTPTVTTGSPSAGSAARGHRPPRHPGACRLRAHEHPRSGATAAPATVDTPRSRPPGQPSWTRTGEYAAYARLRRGPRPPRRRAAPDARIAAAEERHIRPSCGSWSGWASRCPPTLRSRPLMTCWRPPRLGPRARSTMSRSLRPAHRPGRRRPGPHPRVREPPARFRRRAICRPSRLQRPMAARRADADDDGPTPVASAVVGRVSDRRAC